jgi:predicted O-linked N-acetylglucosamine transferase (SPINDLY family)
MANDGQDEHLFELTKLAQAARDRNAWGEASSLYRQALAIAPKRADLWHNLGLSLVGAGQHEHAITVCQQALALAPSLWQSKILVAKSYAQLGDAPAAMDQYLSVLLQDKTNPSALLGAANLELNIFGNPKGANALVAPLLANPDYAMDAQLTNLMSRLYDRPKNDTAYHLTHDVMAFAKAHLQLPGFVMRAPSERTITRKRPRVGLLSNQFGVSPVYFLTMSGWRKVAKGSEIVVFNRGHQADWATAQFQAIASEWIGVQHQEATTLAKTIYESDIDVLYDLGGWMDPVGLQALSLRPARVQYKWVGGQSITTGLDCFDGWIGDAYQSPLRLRHLYSEPLINIDGGYCSYSAPEYLPKSARSKNPTPCVFSNPAKVSQAFLSYLLQKRIAPVFIHRQYRYPQVQARIVGALAELGNAVRFVCPSTHQEALAAVNEHAVMLDTFPYSSGLTAREAIAMGTQVRVIYTGELFCERHTARARK